MACVTAQGDIYSIGALWYFLLTGKTFNFDGPLDAQLQLVSPLERFLLRRSLARDPSDRLASAEGIKNALQEATDAGLFGFFALGRQERMNIIEERFKACHDQKDWIDGWDITEMPMAMGFLEAVLKFEDDDEVRGNAASYLGWLNCEARRIAGEMEQDNPSV
jgi:hypothetical protein